MQRLPMGRGRARRFVLWVTRERKCRSRKPLVTGSTSAIVIQRRKSVAKKMDSGEAAQVDDKKKSNSGGQVCQFADLVRVFLSHWATERADPFHIRVP